MIISFETLKTICNHGGYIKDGSPMCDFKDKRKAKCWAEWQKCCAGNCPFNLKHEDPEAYEQYTFDLEV